MLAPGFAVDGNGQQVGIFDNATGNEFPTPVESIGAEHGYYAINGAAKIDATMSAMDDIAAPIIPTS
jgi:hypothetical protein